MTTRPRRIDGNQPDIVAKLRRVPGVYIHIVSDCAGIGFDLIVRYQERAPMLLEIKSTSRSPLTASEKSARRAYGPYWCRVESFEQALEAIGIPQDGPPIPEGW